MQTLTTTIIIVACLIYFALFLFYYLDSDREKILNDMIKFNKVTKSFYILNALVFMSAMIEIFSNQ